MGNCFVVSSCIHLSASIMNLLWIKLYLAYLWKSVWSFLAEQKTITLIFMDCDILGEPYVTSVSSKYFILLIHNRLKMLFSRPLMFKEAKELETGFFLIHMQKLYQKTLLWHKLVMSSRVKTSVLLFQGHKSHQLLTESDC